MGTPKANHRISKLEDASSSSIGSPSSSSSSSYVNNNKKKLANLLPIFVGLVVITEIAFLSRLDMVKKADLVNSWADSFYQFTTSSWSSSSSMFSIDGGGGGDEVRLGFPGGGGGGGSVVDGAELGSCEAWLESEDSVNYSRDFRKNPVFVHGGEQEFNNCDVGCKFGYDTTEKSDASFGMHGGTASVLRSMESAQYYSENRIDVARRRGYNVVMTTSLSSDVPVGYFSWAEYDIMAPVPAKTEKALAAAFISNCAARNFRLQALEALEKAKITIDSYGGCHRNHDGRVDKVETLKRYKFSLAFENSNEEDYVTEKFFQSLVTGSVPVVVGAPNIQDFSPAPNAILHIKELSDAEKVADTMKYLAENPSAYNETLRWKYEGPSDSFKALVDMAAVHSSCRLCIHLATKIREKEEQEPYFKKRPCKCSRGSETVYHIYVRERGRFDMESVFLRSSNLTLEAFEEAILLKFKSRKHVPVWKQERPESIRGGDELKAYKVYPLGLTQRQALYTFKFKDNTEFKTHVEKDPCTKYEVIFV